ncbi:MAG: AAA family ATPase, partial [Magnetococcales bacterium]|nr:AAA family ATPase [Magnetococcales bacterium]
MAFQITVAKRVKQHVLLSLWGASSSGKTFTALQIAYGLVAGTGQKIGMIDTENRRGLQHVGAIPGEFYHIDLQPPFTADRYIEAFRSFEHAGGFGVVIIDSYSHVWEGEGGTLDQAETSGNIGLAKWSSPKIQLKRLTNVLLRAPMHVIFCMRHKLTKGQDKKGPNGKARIFDTGFAPIAEKNTIYEMGCSFWIGMDHKPIFRQPSETVFCKDDSLSRIHAVHGHRRGGPRDGACQQGGGVRSARHGTDSQRRRRTHPLCPGKHHCVPGFEAERRGRQGRSGYRSGGSQSSGCGAQY